MERYNSEPLFRSLFTQGHSPVLILDGVTGVVVDANEAACDFYGWNRQELLRRTIFEINGLSPDNIRECMQDALHGEQSRFHFRHMVADGSVREVEVHSGPVYYDDKECLCSIVHDVTDKANAERERDKLLFSLKNKTDELARGQVLYQSVLDSIPSLMIVIDAHCRLLAWNRMAETLAVHPLQHGMLLDDAGLIPLQARILQAVKESLSRADHLDILRERMAVDGSEKVFDIRMHPLIDSNGAIEGGGVIRVDDCTERVRMEHVMVQTEKMLSVGGLAAGMAHEINNPLAGILQGAQNIERRIAHDLEMNHAVAEELGCSFEEVKKYLERRDVLTFLEGIRHCGSRASSIVQHMLDFSRRSESKRQYLQLVEVVESALQLAANGYDLRRHFDFKKIRIIKEFQADMPDVPATATEIEQVLLNLFINAAQAMGRTTSERTPELHIRMYIDGKNAVIRIKDTGPGIAASSIGRLFEPFYTTKPVGQGTGLGLAVAYYIIVENHKGTIEAFNHPEGGAVFNIRLPLTMSRKVNHSLSLTGEGAGQSQKANLNG